MKPTERAELLQPLVRDVLASVEQAVEPKQKFNEKKANRVFRISVSDYTESTLLPHLLRRLSSEAPHVILDVLTPSDISYQNVEQGTVDLVINRFDVLPQSFHQMTIWRDTFSCLFSHSNPIAENFNLKNYLDSEHVWVNKTGMGAGVGMEPGSSKTLGWVDEALTQIGEKRRIRVFTRHYQAAMRLAELPDLIVTIPTKAARLLQDNPSVIIKDPPFYIPEIELKMAWSPLVQHNPAHQWLRRLIADVARALD